MPLLPTKFGPTLEVGSEERNKLLRGFAHIVEVNYVDFGEMEVQYFHLLALQNLTFVCACCSKVLASYSGVYKHSKKCKGIHPSET
jgi:hypothetical protein